MSGNSRPSAGWRVRHSAWLLAPILGLGTFSFVGFVYCAFRVRTAKWIRSAVIAAALSAVCWALMLTRLDEDGVVTAGAVNVTLLIWLSMIFFAVVINRDYLNWREGEWTPPVRPQASSSIPRTSPAGPPPESLHTAPLPSPIMAAESPLDQRATTSSPEEVRPAVQSESSERARSDGIPADNSKDKHVVDEYPFLDEGEHEVGAVIETWQDAEALAAWHMQRLGFGDAELTQAGADGGIDVRADQAVAQVKHYATAVGGPVVQQLRGAAHAHDVAIFYALSGFTKAAREYADSADVALFIYDRAGLVEPVNVVARALRAQAGDGYFDAAEFKDQLRADRVGRQSIENAIGHFFAAMDEWKAIVQRNSSVPVTPIEDELRRVNDVITWAEGAGRVPANILLHEVVKIYIATDRVLRVVEPFRNQTFQ